MGALVRYTDTCLDGVDVCGHECRTRSDRVRLFTKRNLRVDRRAKAKELREGAHGGNGRILQVGEMQHCSCL